MRIYIALFILALSVATAVVAAEKSKTRAPLASERVSTNQVVAFYFHGTVRCETCLKMEKQAQELLKQRFDFELMTKRLVFKPVNYDKPENAHFRKDYKLPHPSLVLARQKDGQDQKWKLLNQTWGLIEDPLKFDQYVEEEMRNFLEELD